jgi:RimJ/RimL family protein N-acetyltransferase
MISEKETPEEADIQLRDITENDLPIFFEQQLDRVANHMAAFTSADPTDESAYRAHWASILRDEAITKKTITVDSAVAGHIASFDQDGKREITYWIGKPYWGRGVATKALTEFLRQMPIRPLHARVAKDNLASLRVLQKCGFSIVGEDRGFANARGTETEEFILALHGPQLEQPVQ